MNLKIVRFADRNIGIPACFLLTFYDRLINLFKFKKRPGSKIKKILLMKFWGLGNIILITPALKAIREKFPDAKITFLSLSENKSLLRGLPYIDKILDIKTTGVTQFLADTIKLISFLRNQDYDILIDFEQFARSSAIISYLIGASRRVGFNTRDQMRHGPYNVPVVYNNDKHMVKIFADLAGSLDCKISENYKLIPTAYSELDKSIVEKFFDYKIPQNLVGVHTGAGPNAPVKRWPLERFIELSECLTERFGITVVFTGSEVEKTYINDALNKCNRKILNSAGVFNIPQLAYFISKCRLFISSDTGPLHLAAATGVQTVSLYGPTSPKTYGPLGKDHIVFYKKLPCSPCITNFNKTTITKCRDPRCIFEIKVDEVYQACSRVFSRTGVVSSFSNSNAS